MNSIGIFISCNENIQIFTRALHSWKYWCFHYTRWKYLWYSQPKSKYPLFIPIDHLGLHQILCKIKLYVELWATTS